MAVALSVPSASPPSRASAASMIIRSPNPLAAVLVHISVKLRLRHSGAGLPGVAGAVAAGVGGESELGIRKVSVSGDLACILAARRPGRVPPDTI